MPTQQLRSIAENPFPQNFVPRDSRLLHTKIAYLSNLVSSLNEAVESLGSLDLPHLDEQFDFYQEVERFEMNLIRNALRITGGSQVKAARLLKLKPTTLNAKLKLLKLDPK